MRTQRGIAYYRVLALLHQAERCGEDMPPKKITNDEAMAVLLAQDLIATDALPPLLCDALKAWVLEVLDVRTVPSWVLPHQAELEQPDQQDD